MKSDKNNQNNTCCRYGAMVCNSVAFYGQNQTCNQNIIGIKIIYFIYGWVDGV